jgi:TonB-dependent SusC/RagA subfamily outer membrane receptor
MPVTVTAGEVATADFVLEISAVALDEVVATITGEVRRRELSADIGRIDAAVVAENTRQNDVTKILSGQTTGVQVRSNSGTVGAASDVRIRGTGSVSLSKQPLYVIDGAIVDADNQLFDQFPDDNSPWLGGQQTSRVNDLNPDEIEKIEVIKGPAASALWGARGNAGVIVITTKKGSSETRWNARADLGSNTQTTGVQDDWPVTFFDPVAFGFAVEDPALLYTQNLLREDDPFSSGLYQNYNGNVAGGAGVWNYFGSVQYLNQKGTLPNNAQERFNFRANFGVDPSSKLNISFSNGYTSSNTLMPRNDNDVFGYLGVALVGSPRFHPLEGVQDPITGETVDTCPWNIEIAKDSGVPTSDLSPCPVNSYFANRSFDIVETVQTERKIERYTGSGNVTWNPLQQWTNRFTLGYDMVNDRNQQTFPVDPENAAVIGTRALGFLTKPFTSSRNLTMQGTTTYDLLISQELDFEFTGGVQWFRRTEEANLVTGQTFPATGPAVNNAVITTASDSFDEQKSIGFFVQGQFGISNRLFLNGALRWDNNSASGENLGVQTYPKAGFSWVALEGGDTFNSLRVRGSWGKSGTLPGTNDAFALVQTQQVAFEGTDQLGISPLRPGNPFLQPEEGEEFEAGIDLAMLRDRIGFLVTYYNQKTRNSVVTRDLAPSSGFPNEQFTNIGRIDNRGWEFELDALAIASENFNWDWRFVVSNNYNKIAELVDPIIFGLGGGSQRHQMGLPFGAYVSQSVALDEDGAAAVLTCDETPGTWGPDDTPGEFADFCDPLDDSRYGGQPTGQWFGSAQTTINLFKYVQLYALMDFNTGFEHLNYNGRFLCSFQGGACADIYETNAGTFENRTSDNRTDEALIKEFAAVRSIENPWVENGDWAKLRTVQLRFDMPPSVLRFLKVNGLQFQFIGENLVTWSGYGTFSGLDPEISRPTLGGGSRSEFLGLPPTRRFIGTINIFF